MKRLRYPRVVPAKTSRAKCKECHSIIPKGTPKLEVEIDNFKFKSRFSLCPTCGQIELLVIKKELQDKMEALYGEHG